MLFPPVHIQHEIRCESIKQVIRHTNVFQKDYFFSKLCFWVQYSDLRESFFLL